MKRELKIADESDFMISITLWGDACTAHNFGLGEIFAFRGCRLSDYGGRSLNASSQPNDIISSVGNLKHDRVGQLLKWYKKRPHTELKQSLNMLSEMRGGTGESGSQAVK